VTRCLELEIRPIDFPSGMSRELTRAFAIRAEGVAWGDYNNDGYLDLFVACGATEVVPPGALNPVLYRNNGDGTFTDVTVSAGLNVDKNSYSALWGDFDNDGYLDLFVAALGFGNGPNANRLYRNNGDGTFTDVAELVGLQLNDGVSPHLGASWGDYDNDGFLDLVIKDGLPDQIKGQARLFHNSGNANHFLKVALVGTKSNRLGIGAKAYVTTHGRRTLFREHNGGGGGEFRSQGQQPLHFGLGAVASAVSVTVHWPSGHIDTFPDVPGDSLVTVTENSPGLQIRRLRKRE
jgi:ASPIC/UnbV protein/VCBS repeat protein